MAKKKKQKKKQTPQTQSIPQSTPSTFGTPFSISINIVVFIIGLFLFLVGMAMLFFVDRQATNLPGIFSPILILTGILVIIISLLIGGTSKN